MAARLPGRHARAAVPRVALLSVWVCCLSACGGGGDGGIDLAEGQGPDPVVLDVPIAYVKRPVPLDDNGDLVSSDLRDPNTFDIGADLFVRDRASPSADERNVTGTITEGLGDVRDLEVSYDGTKVLFAMRAQFIENAPEEDQPTWNVWEYDLENDVLRRIIASDITAEAAHDIAPHYLADGRIVFSSTRQRQSSAILLDEGKPQFPGLTEDFDEPAFVLHVMNDDGSDIRQISYNQSHDLDPTLLSDGRIAFVRWDRMLRTNGMHLYAMNPDGTGLELLYGKNSHDTGTDGATIQFSQPRETEGGRLMTIIRSFETDALGGDIVVVDFADFVENGQPTAANIGLLSGPAQNAATVNDVRTNGELSPGGVFGSAFPIWDGTDRLFVSWSQCRLVEVVDPAAMTERIVPCTDERLANPAFTPADPLFGLWIYDRASDTQLPVLQPEEGVIYTDVVAAQERETPALIYDKDSTGELDPVLLDADVGLVNIRSVYDVDGTDTIGIPFVADPANATADQRPARFLRIVKAVSIPDDDIYDFSNTAFGRQAARGMREIIGYLPIEPDGSVVARVPANVALMVSVLDAEGRRIFAPHQSWLQVRPGEELRCHGCHENGSGESHGRSDAFDSAYAGATIDGAPFPNTDSSVFADIGETMAEARARIGCATDCASTIPSVDIVYRDVWTDPVAAGRAPDAPLDYLYDDLTTPVPVNDACRLAWTPDCRVVINYETIIHPLWGEPRLAADGITDVTCTLCHNTQDAMAQLQVPAGQLDLTDGPSSDQPEHFRSYRELLFDDNEQVLDMGALQDRLIEVGIDPVTGDPIFQTVNIRAPMHPAGARSSADFLLRFRPGGSHEGYLSAAELRLIVEWLDIGAQYYNNPFDAPED